MTAPSRAFVHFAIASAYRTPIGAVVTVATIVITTVIVVAVPSARRARKSPLVLVCHETSADGVAQAR